MSQGGTKEYVVRAPKCAKKKYNMMRFHTALGVDFKSWGPTKMERENNLKEYKNADDDLPKYGAGSEFGREEREEARRKRYGISVKKYKADDQPWLLSVDGKQGKKFKGIREGGVSANVSFYVFMQAKDGAFEAFPVEEWYNFQPINRYKSLSAEEAEKEFERRDKIMNYFSVMYQKKLKKDEDGEDDPKKGSTSKSLMLSEMDDWMSDADSNDEDKDDDDSDDDKRRKKQKKGKKNRRKNQGGKRRKKEDGTDDEVDEESDDFDEGAEQDYISEDSSDSEQENDEVARKQLAGVDEGEALRKLLDSEDEEENENEDKKKDEQDEDKEDKDKEDKEKKKKKKKKKDKKDKKNQDSDGHSSDSSSEEEKKKKEEKDSKKNVNALKRKIKESPLEMNDSKRPRISGPNAAASSSSTAAAAANAGAENGVSEELIRRYLMRKPMTTTELLQKCRNKKTGLSSEQLVTAIAQTLKRINLVKQMVKGKMYLSVKNT